MNLSTFDWIMELDMWFNSYCYKKWATSQQKVKARKKKKNSFWGLNWLGPPLTSLKYFKFFFFFNFLSNSQTVHSISLPSHPAFKTLAGKCGPDPLNHRSGNGWAGGIGTCVLGRVWVGMAV